MTAPSVGSRFQILRRLGQGGMGVVYEALDRERNQRVALKTLHALDAQGLLQLKNEFSVLLDLHHPNLVRLGELVSHDEQWFFTMELVDGTDLLTHVRWPSVSLFGPRADAPTMGRGEPIAGAMPRAPPTSEAAQFDEGRLRSAMAQLAAAVTALHEAGKVHRDIKPSNVLVDRAGRLVLLDFGLATDARGATSWTDLRPVGTAAYMAPEQASSNAVGPAADWYSVGVVLYEALTGRLPFVGTPIAMLLDKQRGEPPPPRAVVPGTPADLDALCVDLLRFDPRERPSGADSLRRLGGELVADRRPSTSAAGHAPFVGRDRELAAIESAFAATSEAPVTLLVTGESGVGKSALVRRFTESLGADVIVLAGRCYERASVPYKALDGIVDALVRTLRRLPKDQVPAVLPRRPDLLPLVFPVLGRVEAIAAARGARQKDALDPQQLRAQAFAALRELLSRLALWRRVVVVIDDLHWADADSLALLGELLRPVDGPLVLVLGTMRTHGEDDADLARMRAAVDGDVRILELGGLGENDASRLVRDLVRRAGGASAERQAAIVREALGHPLFLDELVRHAMAHGAPEGVSFDDALWARACALDTTSRNVLSLVCAARGRFSQDVAARAAGIDHGALERVVSLLRVSNLVRTAGARASDAIEPYHDRVREAVWARLDDGARRWAHERLAIAIGSSDAPDAETLAEHWLEAGEVDRAARLFVQAAMSAGASLAFAHAARLYAIALETGRFDDAERCSLYARLGDALASAGQGKAAADAYDAAARGSGGSDALEWRRRAADQLLRSGHIDAGLAMVTGVLAQVDMELPRTPRRALMSLLLRRAHLRLRGLRFEEREPGTIAASELTRIDVCWSVGVGLGVVDHIRGADFQTRNVLLSLDAGEPYRVARALALEAGFASATGGPGAARAAQLLARARELARRIGHPNALAYVTATAGITSFMIGEWARTLPALAEAETILREQCTGVTWELDNVHVFQLSTLYALGHIREMTLRHPELLREATQRGDLYAATVLRTGACNSVWLVADSPERAREEVDGAMRQWSNAGVHVQHVYELIARAQIDLYEGHPDVALGRLDRGLATLGASMLLRVQIFRLSLLDLDARVSIAAALQKRPESAPRVALLRRAERDLGAIDREGMTWAQDLAMLQRGCLAAARSDREGARRAIVDAIARFTLRESRFLRNVARLRLSSLDGTPDAEPIAALAADRAVNPRRVAAGLAPWQEE